MEGRAMTRKRANRKSWPLFLAACAGLGLGLVTPAASADLSDQFHTTPVTQGALPDDLARIDGWGIEPVTPGGPKKADDDSKDYRSHSDVPDLPDGGDPPDGGDSGEQSPESASWLLPPDPFEPIGVDGSLTVALGGEPSDVEVGSPTVGVVPSPGVVGVLALGAGAAGLRRRRG